MHLINEIILDEFTFLKSTVNRHGFSQMFPIDYEVPFKEGDRVYIDDFGLAIYRPLACFDRFVKTEKKMKTVLENACREGIIKCLRKKYVNRNSGKRFLCFEISVSFDSSENDTGRSFDFVFSNIDLIKKVW